MEESSSSNRIESRVSSTPPLHLQDIKRSSNHASRDPEAAESSEGMSIFHDRRQTRVSKRTTKASQKNGRFEDEGSSSSLEGYVSSNGKASTATIPISPSDKKYIRRKPNKFLPDRRQDQLFSTMVILAVVSCTVAFYFTPQAFPVYRGMNSIGIDDGWIPESSTRQQQQQRRPRSLTLVGSHDQFGSSRTSLLLFLPRAAKKMILPKGTALAPDNSTATKIFFDLPPVKIEDDPPSPSPPATTNSSYPEAKAEEKKCLPMAKWMTASFPTCNSFHEIDMKERVSSATYENEEDLKLLAEGWFRSTWKYVNDNLEGLPPVVLKTLRIEREFLDEYFDLHRRDSVAMERLTFSPFVLNVYGHCGQSAINEFAEGVLNGKLTNLEQLNRAMRGKETDPLALLLKLRLATSVSLGLAHVHNSHISDTSGGRSKSVQSLLYEHTDPNSTHSTTGFGRSVPTMAHYDINPRNIAVMKDGTIRLNDFNIAEFLTYDPETNQTCGFRSRLHEPWWRAPEEMDTSHQTMVNEKVDIYALGEVLFHILTTHGPRGKMKKDRMDEVRALVRKGIPPTMWEPYASGGEDGSLKRNPIVKALMKAMDLCFEPDPKKRGTAIQIARILHKTLVKEESKRQKP